MAEAVRDRHCALFRLPMGKVAINALTTPSNSCRMPMPSPCAIKHNPNGSVGDIAGSPTMSGTCWD
ncbi:MAG: hypothetical protein CM15mP77_1540 [Synechococcus sp.]|nr:MAG: hypothetical protein CM15mP77_1540 [Synechococcus sp.]